MTNIETGNLGRVNTAGAEFGDFHAQAEVTHDGRAKINLHNFKLEAHKLISQRIQEYIIEMYSYAKDKYRHLHRRVEG
jgi:hypothetical protein